MFGLKRSVSSFCGLVQATNNMTSQNLVTKLFLGCLCLLVASCATTAEQPAESSGKEAVRALLEQEAVIPVETPVSIPELGLSMLAPGSLLGPIEEIEDGWYFNLESSLENPLHCYVFDDTFAASQTKALTLNIVATLGEDLGVEPTVSRVYTVDAGAYDNMPYLALEWLARYELDVGSQILHLKTRSVTVNGLYLGCVLLTAGYSKSYEVAFEQMARSIKLEKNLGVEPYFETIHTTGINDLVVGYQLISMALDEDGDTVIYTDRATLAPRGGTGELSASDSYKKEFSTPEGYLINAFASGLEDDDVSYRLTLGWADADVLVVEGDYQGKEISGELHPEDDMLSALGIERLTQEVAVREEASELSLESWGPEPDPLGLLRLLVSKNKDTDGKKTAKVTLDTITMDFGFSEDGTTESYVMKLGENQLNGKLVYKKGSVF